MSEVQFKSGDVVILRSGGPKMTIRWVEEEYGTLTASCSWFDTKGEIREKTFSTDQLKPSDD